MADLGVISQKKDGSDKPNKTPLLLPIEVECISPKQNHRLIADNSAPDSPKTNFDRFTSNINIIVVLSKDDHLGHSATKSPTLGKGFKQRLKQHREGIEGFSRYSLRNQQSTSAVRNYGTDEELPDYPQSPLIKKQMEYLNQKQTQAYSEQKVVGDEQIDRKLFKKDSQKSIDFSKDQLINPPLRRSRRVSSSVDMETPLLKHIISENPGGHHLDQLSEELVPSLIQTKTDEFFIQAEEGMSSSEVVKHDLNEINRENIDTFNTLNINTDYFSYGKANPLGGSFMETFTKDLKKSDIIISPQAKDIVVHMPESNSTIPAVVESQAMKVVCSTNVIDARSDVDLTYRSSVKNMISQERNRLAHKGDPLYESLHPEAAVELLQENENEKKHLRNRIHLLNLRISQIKKSLEVKKFSKPSENSTSKKANLTTELFTRLNSVEYQENKSKQDRSQSQLAMIKTTNNPILDTKEIYTSQVKAAPQARNVAQSTQPSLRKSLRKDEILKKSLPSNYLDYVDAHLERYKQRRKESLIKSIDMTPGLMNDAIVLPGDEKKSDRFGIVLDPKLNHQSKDHSIITHGSLAPISILVEVSPVKQTKYAVKKFSETSPIKRRTKSGVCADPCLFEPLDAKTSSHFRVQRNTVAKTRLSSCTLTEDGDDIPGRLKSPKRSENSKRPECNFIMRTGVKRSGMIKPDQPIASGTSHTQDKRRSILLWSRRPI